MVGFPTIRCGGEHATNDGAYHKAPPQPLRTQAELHWPPERGQMTNLDQVQTLPSDRHLHREARRPLGLT